MPTCKCTCPVGYNGKYCKHQATVIKAFNILTSINTLSIASPIHLYDISTGKNPDNNLVLLFLINYGDVQNNVTKYKNLRKNLFKK